MLHQLGNTGWQFSGWWCSTDW